MNSQACASSFQPDMRQRTFCTPVIYLLAIVGQQEPPSVTAMTWPADRVHFGFHLALGAAGLAAYRWALGRRLGRR